MQLLPRNPRVPGEPRGGAIERVKPAPNEKPTPEFLDREKTFDVALADDDAGAGSAVVKMAPVETRDPYGDMLMSGAFDAAKGKAIPVLAGHSTSTPPLGKAVYTGEKSGKFMATMAFNDTNGSQEWRKAAKTGVVQASVRFRAAMKDVDLVEGKGLNIKKAVLRELSLTGLGAMPGTGLSRVKTGEPAADEPAPAIPFPRSLAASDLAHRRL